MRRTKLGTYWAFRNQYQGLLLSSLSYDAGFHGEAARMANAIYILLGPTRRNHQCLLLQLGVTTEIESTNRTTTNPGEKLFYVMLVPVPSETEGESGNWFISATPFGPLFDGSQRLSVEDWWAQHVIRSNAGPLSRLDVVQILRDQDGGAHVDRSIENENYLDIFKSGAGFNFHPAADAEQVMPVERAIEATIRQMAYEALHSLAFVNLMAARALQNAAEAGALSPQFFEPT